jgi:hypothetical protein
VKPNPKYPVLSEVLSSLQLVNISGPSENLTKHFADIQGRKAVVVPHEGKFQIILQYRDQLGVLKERIFTEATEPSLGDLTILWDKNHGPGWGAVDEPIPDNIWPFISPPSTYGN